MKVSLQIKGIKEKKMWAVFAPDGYLQFRTIADTKRESESRVMRDGSDLTWEDYAKEGYTTNKILIDIKVF